MLDDTGGTSVRGRGRQHSLPEWITPMGIDPAKLPLEPILRQALEQDEERFHSACTLLETIVSRGRREAGIFLLGLLSYYSNDLQRLSRVVRAVAAFQSREAVDALTNELRRIKSSNTTRGYLDSVLKALTLLPRELVEERLAELSGDKGFSAKWRRKFDAAAWSLSGREGFWQDE